MLDGMSDSIQRSRIENLHSREVDRQSPTGLIFLDIKLQKCSDLENHVRVRQVSPFDVLSCVVSEIFNVEKCRDLEIGV